MIFLSNFKVAPTPHVKSRKRNLDADLLDRRLRINLQQQPLRQIDIKSSPTCQEGVGVLITAS
jgi:hypothetical protein